MEKRKLVAVSNRLPVILKKVAGRWSSEPGAGGLVTALAPVLKDRGGMWIGWPGTTEQRGVPQVLRSLSSRVGYKLVPVLLDGREADLYYNGYSNEIIWPLFHDLHAHCHFDPGYWKVYLEVNRKFADRICEHTSAEDYIWVHDYHLMNVAQALREIGLKRTIGFFLHIPFPPMDIFVRLPWRKQILEALMWYDLVGFQTSRDRRNFLECLQRYYPETRVHGRGTVVQVQAGSRSFRVGSFPISIDFEGFASRAASRSVERRIHFLRNTFHDRTLILGVDRMDYTKGIREKLEGYRSALSRFPELRGRVVLLQILVPSRFGLEEYQILKARVDRLIGEINGQFAMLGWNPVHYHYRSLADDELLALYRAADIALVTPLKDGMNLVAKEFCACSLDDMGVLILSEFAGAAAEFQKGALMVNPHDVEGVADAIHQAVNMGAEEKMRRMALLRRVVRRHDIFRWVDWFLRAAFSKTLDDFPGPSEDYVPGA